MRDAAGEGFIGLRFHVHVMEVLECQYLYGWVVVNSWGRRSQKKVFGFAFQRMPKRQREVLGGDFWFGRLEDGCVDGGVVRKRREG